MTEKDEDLVMVGGGFDFIEHMQQMHSMLDIEFDSIHTIDFFRMM